MAASRLNTRKLDVFNSVFQDTLPPQVQQRTLLSTHDKSPTRRSQRTVPDGRRSLAPSSQPVEPPSTARSGDQMKWNKSWDKATTYLLTLLEDLRVNLPQCDHETRNRPLSAPSPGVRTALANITQAERLLPAANQEADLLSWYSQQTRHYFIQYVFRHLTTRSFKSSHDQILGDTVQVLEEVHRVYLHGFSLIVDTHDRPTSNYQVKRFRRDLHALIESAVFPHLQSSLSSLISERVSAILNIPDQGNKLSHASEIEDARSSLLAGIGALYNIGLAGEEFQVILAEVMSDAMSKYVSNTFSKHWSSPDLSFSHRDIRESLHAHSRSVSYARQDRSSIGDESLLPRVINQTTPSQCVWDLCKWIESSYAQLGLEITSILDNSSIAWEDIEKWKEMGIGRLARLRTSELFEITQNWPNATGALDDLRASINTPQKRLQLTDSFSIQLKREVLHPAASTLQILRTYIAMIRSFHSLDHSKVLLDRVAFPLQVYLCSRQDTVRIIIAGLLSDTEDVDGVEIPDGGDTLVELAKLLNDGTDTGQAADEHLDWDDMEWQPDPVDAGPRYRRSKSADVIGTLIGVLGSAEIFIKEFQSIIGENLLRQEQDFGKELKLLDLLKTRFGEGPLQNCEVMVRDILMSRELNSAVRRRQYLDPTPEEVRLAEAAVPKENGTLATAEGQLKTSLNAKILSRLYWPDLVKDSYRIPAEVASLQAKYEEGFEALKQTRKLTWLQTLGQAKVELQFQDRVFEEECLTWQATVIWAFQSKTQGKVSPTRTVDELVQQLEMNETLVRKALKFWVSKMVLKQTATIDSYMVLETLSNEDLEISNANASAQAAGAVISTSDNTNILGGTTMGPTADAGISSEKKTMYWMFIQGMLKNSATQMPTQQIAMMLKMLITEGTISDDDLKVLLGEKVKEGILEVKAGRYKLVKK